MKSRLAGISATAFLTALSMHTSPAMAQAAAVGVPEAAQESIDSGDIVVTARRREERLQDVPVAVTAVTGDALTQANIFQVQDIQQKVPGLTIQPSSFGSNVLQVAIRGQRQFDPYITKDPAVAVYFADVVQNRPQGLNSGIFDIASVQVLKGPQGTLFGRNTTGGAMIITPNAPGPEFEGYLTVGYGNYDAKRAEGAINIPVNDWLQIRAAGAVQRRDGFTKNLTTGQRLDDEHKDNWRVSVRLTPFDGFENRLVVNGFKAHENGVAYKLIGRLPGVGLGSAPAIIAELDQLANLPFHTTLSDVKLDTTVKTFALSNISELELGDGATVRNIFGYRTVSSHIPFDFDGSSQPYFPSREDMHVKQYSNELQVLGTILDGSLDYIVGGFYFLENGRDRQQSGGLGGVPGNGDRVTFADPIRNESYSGFAQFTYRLPFLEGVSLTAGGRQNHDKRELTSRQITSTGICRLVDSAGTPLNPCTASFGKSYNRFTYSVTADWKVTNDVLLYVSHRKGYRTGGFNISATTPAQFTPFNPETVKDIEAGLKLDFRMNGGSGRFNLAAYSQDYSDIQRNQGFISNGVFVQSIVNAAAARIKGFEAELELHPTRNVDFGLNIAHIDAQYTSWIDGRTGADLTQSDFAGTPAWTVSSNIGFHVPLANDAGELGVRADVYHQAKTNNSDNNFYVAGGIVSPTSILQPYTLVNGRIEWSDVGGLPLTASLWGKNLFDVKYYAGGTELANTGLGFTANFMGAPRTYGLELSYRF